MNLKDTYKNISITLNLNQMKINHNKYMTILVTRTNFYIHIHAYIEQIQHNMNKPCKCIENRHISKWIGPLGM